jgi:hypothetical protein
MGIKRDITRAIIDTTVDRGLREVDEDPRRGIRKLTDLGRQFTQGRFMHEIYQMFQDLLRNDESPYYTAIEHVLHHTNRKALKDFGINMGYSSLTVGARRIRNIKKKQGFNVPWAIFVSIDPKSSDSINADELSFMISSAKELGVYSYMIYITRSMNFVSELIDVFKANKDCAFFLVLPDEELDDQTAEALAGRTNVFSLLTASGDQSDTNAFTLRRLKAWYGVLDFYNENSTDIPLSEERTRNCMSMESSFVILCAEKGTSIEKIIENTNRIKEMRLEPEAALFVFDLYGDTMGINHLASGEDVLFEIDPDRTINTNLGTFGKYEKGTDLKEVFSKIFAG